ncbi:MAG: IS3 family transposase [Planctomycetes bacterium]|nr:IS3 family transposase [Planctomycetota bacterium]
MVRQGDHVCPQEGFQFVRSHQRTFAIETQCRVLGISVSGFYASRSRALSARARRDSELRQKVLTSHESSHGTYGAPRVHADLQAAGERVGRKRVARLMRQAGLCGVSPRSYISTTTRDRSEPLARDLVKRNFTADAPNKLWVSDITYVPTWEGFLYLAIVLDVFSRRIVG